MAIGGIRLTIHIDLFDQGRLFFIYVFIYLLYFPAYKLTLFLYLNIVTVFPHPAAFHI